VRVPLSWLKDFTPLDSTVDELTDTFNSLGLVVEGVEHVGSNLDGVVVGRVLEVRAHPNADKVRLADVDLGDGEPLQIACGAANLEAGQLVPVATIGTVLPGDFKIDRRKLRGEWSNGMICSADELGLAEERSPGILVLPDDLTVGMPFADAMDIRPDVVFDLEIETNRPDAMCISGVARDVAGKLGLPFSIPEPVANETGPETTALITVDIQDTDVCPRFTARVISNIHITSSPRLIQERLTLAGMRPINNVVDASNYVMLELGQPSHPYDLQRVGGNGFIVRKSRPGETIETLDESRRELPEGAAVVCDADDSIIGVAGIMGGASSEINSDTTTVVNEAAVWEPYSINYTSRKLALRTDASARFERRIDREGVIRAQNRFVEILTESSPDIVVSTGIIDRNVLPAWPSDTEHVTVRTARVNSVLGTQLDDEVITNVLGAIGFKATLKEPGIHDVVIPPFRPDNEREIDVIEEVARIYGYDKIERRVTTSPMAARLTPYQERRRRLRSVLVGRGYSETWTAALIGPDDVEKAKLNATPIAITNPVAREESLLRPSFLPGMLRAVAFNVARQNDDLQLFEIGHVFNQPSENQLLPNESEHVAVTLAAPDASAPRIAELWRDLLLTLNIHGINIEGRKMPGMHPTRTAALVTDEGATIGSIGEVDPQVLQNFDIPGRVAWIEVDTVELLDRVTTTPQMKPVSKFPATEFDLAFVVPNDVAASAVERTLREATGDMLEQLTLFDVFRSPQLGDDRRSLAYRLRLASLDKTLDESATADVRTSAITAVETKHHATLRS
jgi:phenylalanyl-tRNA synthetase beta chain